MNFGSIARIVTRPSNETGTECDLIVGTMLRGRGASLKPNTIYEIKSMFDTLTLVEVGECMVSHRDVRDSQIGVTWGQSFEDVVVQAGQYLLISKEEYATILKARESEAKND